MPISSRFKSLLQDLLPPILARSLRRGEKQVALSNGKAAAMDAFYGGLLRCNSLCFDVGANLGERVASFRRLGGRVVAVEPQPRCLGHLQANFADNPEVTIVPKAAGSAPGQATMMLSNEHTLSTLSRDFVEATTRSGRFNGAVWNESVTVEVVTLDDLIAQFGVPDFIKVDVEGFELEVIRGLSRPIHLISLEWAPEMTDNILRCVDVLSKLGPISCNLSWMESMRLSRREWMNPAALVGILEQFRDETYLFGDVYIRSDAGAFS